MSIVMVRQSAMTIPIPIPIGMWVPGAMFIGVLMSICRLGALLDRVSPLCGSRSLPRLDPSDLVDLNLCLGRVLNVNVHQRRVKRH